ncbi:hypothetical protein B0H10DRAFT_2240271 [Mycena sp. CBHHK59/15]|nr:hypothetical protein B0H10DRAFT_2240271 [Mycena sp. CBHHK59/15]
MVEESARRPLCRSYTPVPVKFVLAQRSDFSSIQIKADIRSDHKKLGIYKEPDCGEADLDPEDEADDDLTPRLPNRLPAWKPMTLEVLFGGAEKPRARKLSTKVMEEEERLMEELADELEDQEPDEGAIEIDSDDEYRA